MSEKKFVDKIDVRDWLVETDDGFKPVKTIGKTIPYNVWNIKTHTGKTLDCADTHVLFNGKWREVLAKDLVKGESKLRTVNGLETVTEVRKTDRVENMYDLEVDDDKHRYITNGFVSHNSIFLCNDAANFIKMGKNVAFITLEMSEKKVIKRIGANLLDIPISKYDTLSNDRDYMVKRITEFRRKQLTPLGRLFIKEYPTGCCTTIDIENYIRQLEETHGIKIHAVVIDYINIMRNHRNSNSENTYITIKQLAEDLRAVAVKMNLLVITATQSTRTAFDSNDIVLSQVSESMGLVATSDTVYGIIQDNELKINNEYFLKMLKIRDGFGKNNKLKLNIDYSRQRLTETGVWIHEDGTVNDINEQKPTKVIKVKQQGFGKRRSDNADDGEDAFGSVGIHKLTPQDMRRYKEQQEEISQSDLDF